ncbi:hypothetical protein GCM10022378_08250 [Salinicoccus jeotgali]|uniref:Alcohol acetyltransferase n=1 Tax=Salinicoccus jeotgali TaxID=381634 RepID=A0ABP7ELD6_9STAP
MDEWYKIDNTGKIFHAVSDATNSAVFRVAMILKEKIDKDTLQEALDIVAVRFPTLKVRVRKGLFWDFMEHNDELLSVKREAAHPCAPIDAKENNAYLIRVLYFDRRISVEIFHSVTDGGGAVEFLKTLVYQYLMLRGMEDPVGNDILVPEDPPRPEEMEDSFERFATSRNIKRTGPRLKPSYQIKGVPIDPPGINVIHGVMDAGRVNAFAKAQGTSLTGFLLSVLIQAIHDEKKAGDRREERIAIAVPVSLRRHFPSTTLRNFFYVANIDVSMDGYMQFDSLIKEVSTQLADKTDKENLQAGINRFVSLQSNLLTRAMPVLLKYPIMRFGFNQFGERLKTMTLSNLGNIKLPDAMKPHVDRMEVVLYPTRKSPINCGIGTLNDRLTITFSRSIIEQEIIRTFFMLLKEKTGQDITVYSNDWGDEI